MEKIELDLIGKRCPLPILTLANTVIKKELKSGDIVVIKADCPTFEFDLKKWCAANDKMLIVVKEINGVKIAHLRI